MKRSLGLVLSLGLAATALSGCVTIRSSHGYVLERGESSVAAEAGVDTKETVLARYGEPSTIAAFDPNVWYYISSLEQQRAFLKERTSVRKVVAVKFAQNGKVEKVENFSLDDGEEISLVKRVTPTRGKEMSFLEQLLGNVGRLPAPQPGQGGAPGGQRGPGR